MSTTKQRRRFTPEKKTEILKYGEKHGVPAVKAKFKISDGLFYKWKSTKRLVSNEIARAQSSSKIEKSWVIESDDNYITIRIPKKEVTKHLLSTLL